jgi:putative intracellular protease/amidase
MTTIVTILTEGFADWETALLSAAGASYYQMTTRFASPDGKAITSSGGMTVTPDMAVDDVDVDTLDALVVCGGSIWSTREAPDLSRLLRSAYEHGKVVAGICDGTKALASAGLLDTIAHTSNSAETLASTGYGGAANYRDTPGAVSDDGIVTASGTAPVVFTAEVMRALGMGGDQLDYYVGLHAAQHERPASA